MTTLTLAIVARLENEAAGKAAQKRGDVMTRFRTLCLGVAALIAASTYASAQSYPNQTVRIVVPFTAGSATDILARIVGDKLAERWGQQVVIDNRPGVAGTASVARSAADGYTLMLTSNGHTITALTNKNLPFDPMKDFAGITQVASVPLVLIVNPNLAAKSVKEFIDLAKAKPGTLNFASPGVTSTTFIAGTLFKKSANIDIVHVPYKGAPESVTAVIRGDSHMYFTPSNVGADLIQAGQVRAIAVSTAKRLPILPDVPTIVEAGLPSFSYDSWFGLMMPANGDPAVVGKINRDTVQVLQMPDVQEKLARQGVVPVFNKTPAEFDAIIKQDAARFTELLKDSIN
jgi:tripartite-type tricarboxylate transporter receptor subunit TctC